MSGTARRTKELAETLKNLGHEVSVISSFPRVNRKMPGYKTKSFQLINGVKVYRTKNIFDVGKIPLFRMISYSLSTIWSLVFISKKRNNFDLLLSVSPLASGLAGAVTNYLYKIYHHFDVPDILPDLGVAAGMLKNKYLIKILFIIEKWVYSNSISISLTTKGHKNNLIAKGVPKEKLKWMPDWIDEEYYFNSPVILFKKEKNYLFSKNNKIITFLGNIGALQGPDTFLTLMKEINHEEKHKVKFLFIGNGIMVPSLKARINNEGIKNIHFLGNIDRSHVRSYLNISNILISNYLDNPALDTYIPGKIFEYIISGKPIIMGGRGDVKELIEKYNAGIVVDPSDVGLFKNAIYNILSGEYYLKTDTTKFLLTYSMKNVINRYNKMIYSFDI